MNREIRKVNKVLVVEHRKDIRENLREYLEKNGYDVMLYPGDITVTQSISEFSPSVVLLDIIAPEIDGTGVLEEVLEKHPDIPVIIITDHATISKAVEAMRHGVYDFVTVPIDFTRLSVSVRNAVEFNRLANRYSTLESMHEPYQFDGMIGISAEMQTIYKVIENVGGTNANVFIIGESGTGKELVARAIHRNSPRASNPMAAINCAAIPHALLESELFGHEKGAFTGAYKRTPGIFQIADGSTIFLDEICEMSLALQVKLLRFIQERKFIPVGGYEDIEVDVRIIAATNKDPVIEIHEGRFREDLYYRLLVVPIEVPPLRERREDIPILAMHFLEEFAIKHSKSFFEYSPEAMKLLINYSWKGNVRELENVVEALVVLHESRIVFPKHLPDIIHNHVSENPEADRVEIQVRHLLPGEERIIPFKDVERQIIEDALRRCNGNVLKAARKLRLGQATVYRKIKAYDISI